MDFFFRRSRHFGHFLDGDMCIGPLRSFLSLDIFKNKKRIEIVGSSFFDFYMKYA